MSQRNSGISMIDQIRKFSVTSDSTQRGGHTFYLWFLMSCHTYTSYNTTNVPNKIIFGLLVLFYSLQKHKGRLCTQCPKNDRPCLTYQEENRCCPDKSWHRALFYRFPTTSFLPLSFLPPNFSPTYLVCQNALLWEALSKSLCWPKAYL